MTGPRTHFGDADWRLVTGTAIGIGVGTLLTTPDATRALPRAVAFAALAGVTVALLQR